MSLIATSYRYEIDSCNAKSLQKALKRQQCRIKEDEKYATQQSTADSEKMVNEVSKWSESLEEASERRRVKREAVEVKSELRMANKASLLVRQAQLKRLLEQDQDVYEKELSRLGNAFYQERL